MENKIKALPSKTVQKLNLGERMLGKRLELELPDSVTAETESRQDLVGDTFFQMFKRDPRFKEQVPEGREANRLLLDWAGSNSGFKKARQTVRGNLPASITSAKLMYAHLTTDEVYQEALKKQDEADEAKKEAQKQQTMANAFGQAASDLEGEGDSDGAKTQRENEAQAKLDAGQALEKYNQAVAQLKEEIEKLENNKLAQASLNSAANEAEEEGEKVQAAMRGWGTDAGNQINSDPAQALKFMELYSEKLQQISEMIGRMKGIALNARKSIKTTGFIPSDIEQSQDLTRTLPTELARLSQANHPALRTLAWVEYLDNGLRSWKMSGDGDKAGNFYAALDESYSMYGIEEIISKGVLLGICQTAKDEGREYRLGAFASNHNDIRELYSETSWEEHLNWASSFIGGGTSFDKALTWIMDAMEKDGEDGMELADAVVITDGYAPLSKEVADRWLEIKDETGARLLYIPVVPEDYDNKLKDIADKVLPITSLQDGGENIAKQTASWLR